MTRQPPSMRIAKVSIFFACWFAAMAGVYAFARTSSPLPAFVAGAILIALTVWVLGSYVPVAARRAIRRGQRSPSTPRVALTFDDGPTTDTLAVLDALDAAGVQATFFMLGSHAEKHPELVQAVVERGHVVGNHAYSHRVLPVVPPAAIGEEIDRTQEILVAAGAPRPRLFRPPGGFHEPLVRQALAKRGLTLVGWTPGARDSERSSAEDIARTVAARPRDGDILLLHDGADIAGQPGGEQTAEAIPLIVDAYRSRGFQFVTLPEMIGEAREVR